MSSSQIEKEIVEINNELINIENKLNSEINKTIKDQLINQKISLLTKKALKFQILIQYQNHISNQIKKEIQKNKLLLINKNMNELNPQNPIKRRTYEINNNINFNKNESDDMKMLKNNLLKINNNIITTKE